MAGTFDTETPKSSNYEILRGVVERLLKDLQDGAGDRDKRRQVEEWMRSLADKFPEFRVDQGLRDYYLAEAKRLRDDFEKANDIIEKVAIGRSMEGYLDRASESEKKMTERA
ncbi:MAG TPA: hypothetical protein VIL97_04040 [Thermoanaerobaculia bacterium]